MKKLLFLFGGLLASTSLFAQVETPQLSPKTEVEQVVGRTEFTLEYSRPSLRGRDMHKDIIPLDKRWRLGANKNTTISFDTDVIIGGEAVKTGTYAMYATPRKSKWEIVLYKDHENSGLPKEWDENKVVASWDLEVLKSKDEVETLTLSFHNLTTESANLVLSWSTTRIKIPFELPTKKLVQQSIDKTMKGEPTERDFYKAADYYLGTKQHLKVALEYINKAIEQSEDTPFYYVRRKALIQHELGMNKEAIESAKMSLKLAKEAGNDGYVRQNEESIKEWSK